MSERPAGEQSESKDLEAHGAGILKALERMGAIISTSGISAKAVEGDKAPQLVLICNEGSGHKEYIGIVRNVIAQVGYVRNGSLALETNGAVKWIDFSAIKAINKL